jgi:hypothetical protein
MFDEFETSDPWYFKILKFVEFETMKVCSGTTIEDEDECLFIDRVSTSIGNKSIEWLNRAGAIESIEWL